ncbi:Imidazole glycerol phosphate synthase subunit HisF [subsurface metagenome]
MDATIKVFVINVGEKLNIPVIASSGCGNPKHMLEVFKRTQASAALAASIFHYETYGIKEVKEYLAKRRIAIRPE